MKTALVTGAAGGIGKAICDVFHQADYNVIGVDRRPTKNPPYEVLDYDISRLAHFEEETNRFRIFLFFQQHKSFFIIAQR